MIYSVTFKSNKEEYKIEFNPTSSQLTYSVNDQVLKVRECGNEFTKKDLLKQGRVLATKKGTNIVKQSW